ncbi:MAG: insulinase family protein, partial [Muribaculaceae bacterium]|nr:insulinase family protein [Muribaculaceae bacterium]
MIRRILSLSLFLLCVVFSYAQQPLPLNPEVKYGVLDNGLTYYILHNEMPKNRANFYIAQKVGSALETPEQYGLAHFLEHMAFNGTKHYPGDSMLRYLESKGIRFGADINAYTDYEETVYNIDNVPTDNVALMDSVLLAIRDWSCDLLLEDEEIDAERKVIQEEWRMRNDPRQRFRVAM